MINYSASPVLRAEEIIKLRATGITCVDDALWSNIKETGEQLYQRNIFFYSHSNRRHLF